MTDTQRALIAALEAIRPEDPPTVESPRAWHTSYKRCWLPVKDTPTGHGLAARCIAPWGHVGRHVPERDAPRGP